MTLSRMRKCLARPFCLLRPPADAEGDGCEDGLSTAKRHPLRKQGVY
ncbi:exported protein of unknown function [Legionella longbeachae NSW150]|uniref:Uncharacterized protein n=1 Tax=Legionella longbeachae serogroup 1 (strain NSW150) TaxID=661367 RepID=D3HKT4_LEGLN|nr:exported protein of unknown function [Legionella longbeachae NSW150]